MENNDNKDMKNEATTARQKDNRYNPAHPRHRELSLDCCLHPTPVYTACPTCGTVDHSDHADYDCPCGCHDSEVR